MQDVYPVITWPQTIPHPTKSQWVGEILNWIISVQASRLLFGFYLQLYRQSASQGKDRNGAILPLSNNKVSLWSAIDSLDMTTHQLLHSKEIVRLQLWSLWHMWCRLEIVKLHLMRMEQYWKLKHRSWAFWWGRMQILCGIHCYNIEQSPKILFH